MARRIFNTDLFARLEEEEKVFVQRLSTFFFLALVLALLALPLVLLAEPQDDKPPRPRGGVGFGQFGGPRQPTEEEKEKARLRIGITKEQQAQIEALFNDTDRQMREIMGRIRELSEQLRAEYDKYDFDRNLARSLRRQIMSQRWRVSNLHANNEEKLRKILNREQFDKLRALIKEQFPSRRREPDHRGGPPKPGM
jgi:Spy/CpxP family protein refolding chaperone